MPGADGGHAVRGHRSWINETDLPGKPLASMFYMAGMIGSMEEMAAIKADGYSGFQFG